MKVVINGCYGGFSLSKAAYKELGLEWDGYGFAYADDRSNPKLVEVVENSGTTPADSVLGYMLSRSPTTSNGTSKNMTA